MAKPTEGTAQRRKLLGEIERLAEIAVFGTLSETYRTCGREGCHCQGDGPKHGPHLNVSYRGEKGKTTGYYVPKGAEEATREGVTAGKIRSAICSAPARPIRNDALVPSNPCLLRTAGSVTRPYSGSRLELPACRQLGILIRSSYQRLRLAHQFSCRKHGVRSGSRWTFRISGPGLWIDCGQYGSTRPGGPRATGTDGLGKLPVKPATQTNAIEQPCPRNYWFSAEN